MRINTPKNLKLYIKRKDYKNSIQRLYKYLYRKQDYIRWDYNTKTIIIIIEKYQLKDKAMFINYKTYQKQLQHTICKMTGKLNLNVII